MNELLEKKSHLLGSFLLFTQYFYRLRTGRDFNLSQPVSRESHFITISKAFTKVLRGETTSLLINVAPGTGKSELCKHFVAWALAHYPDSNFIYVSYSHELAAKHTEGIRQIVSLPMYKKLFNLEIDGTSRAKDNFRTNKGGAVYAAGSSGSITGYDAGLPLTERFSGALIIDDIHKPDEVHSDTIRERVKKNYAETILPRLRSPKVPIISIGQRLHEDDLSQNIKEGMDGRQWETVILKSVDDAGNALYPEIHTKEMLLNLQEKSPYVFASQHQQNPQPAGGGIFKPEWFVLLDEEPDIVATFITADTAETNKEYNDPTVFSFWGLYPIKIGSVETGLMGLHWIDCYEDWLEPKDLEATFMQFWSECMRHKVKPQKTAIEKKSTGTFLLSILQKIQGMSIVDVERTRESGSKTARFLEIQPYIASKQISLPSYGRHSQKCIEHMRKITANDTHRHDDRADTCYDAIKLGLIDKSIYFQTEHAIKESNVIHQLSSHFSEIQNLRSRKWQM
jgi:predicted phage terminase large subunit-like protein